jgi:hypothetical protein
MRFAEKRSNDEEELQSIVTALLKVRPQLPFPLAPLSSTQPVLRADSCASAGLPSHRLAWLTGRRGCHDGAIHAAAAAFAQAQVRCCELLRFAEPPKSTLGRTPFTHSHLPCRCSIRLAVNAAQTDDMIHKAMAALKRAIAATAAKRKASAS